MVSFFQKGTLSNIYVVHQAQEIRYLFIKMKLWKYIMEQLSLLFMTLLFMVGRNFFLNLQMLITCC